MLARASEEKAEDASAPAKTAESVENEKPASVESETKQEPSEQS